MVGAVHRHGCRARGRSRFIRRWLQGRRRIHDPERPCLAAARAPMTTRWFVQSRGPRREHPDYAWRAVGAPDIDSGSRYAREVLEQGWRGYGCLDLIDDESEGALLFDDRGQGLVLLITGLTPAERPTDFLRRPIRVALLGTAGSDDPMAWSELTAVASQALRGGLAENLPITFYDESAERDFEIDAA